MRKGTWRKGVFLDSKGRKTWSYQWDSLFRAHQEKLWVGNGNREGPQSPWWMEAERTPAAEWWVNKHSLGRWGGRPNIFFFFFYFTADHMSSEMEGTIPLNSRWSTFYLKGTENTVWQYILPLPFGHESDKWSLSPHKSHLHQVLWGLGPWISFIRHPSTPTPDILVKYVVLQGNRGLKLGTFMRILPWHHHNKINSIRKTPLKISDMQSGK